MILSHSALNEEFSPKLVEHCKYITWSGKKLIQVRLWERNILNINWKLQMSLNTDRMKKAPKKYKRKKLSLQSSRYPIHPNGKELAL